MPVAIQTLTSTTDLIHYSWHNYTDIAAVALLVYDFFLTVDREAKYFWPPRKGWITFLFFINRYMVFLALTIDAYAQVSTNVTYSFCKFAIGVWLLVTDILQLMVTDIILWVRVCALYGNTKKIRILLFSLLTLCTITSIFVLGVVGARSRGTDHPTSDLQHCAVQSQYHFLWAFWIPVLCYESVMFSLVAYRTYIYLQNRRTYVSQILDVLLRDSLIYFATILVLFVLNSVLFSLPDPSTAGLVTCPTLVLLSIMGNRMLLNLREEDAKSLVGPAASQQGPGESLHFAHTQDSAGDQQNDDFTYERT